MEEKNKDLLYEFGYEELAKRAVDEFDDAIMGIITDGCSYGIAYDYSKIPCDELQLVSDDDFIVEPMEEASALNHVYGVGLVMGNDGENEYPGSIIGITEGGTRLVYDYNKIAECKMKDYPEDEPDAYGEACQDIDFNIIRALPYFANSPLVLVTNFSDYE